MNEKILFFFSIVVHWILIKFHKELFDLSGLAMQQKYTKVIGTTCAMPCDDSSEYYLLVSEVKKLPKEKRS